MKILTGTILGAFVMAAAIGGVAAPASAQKAGDKLMMEINEKVKDAKAAKIIHSRRSAMRGLGGSMKVIAGYVKEGKGSPAAVAGAAGRIAAIADKIPSVLVAGTTSDKFPGATRLKPEAFGADSKAKQIAQDLAKSAKDLQKVASSAAASRATIGAAMGAVGKNCGECHKAYRGERN